MIIMDAIRLLQHAKCARKQRDQVKETRRRGRREAGGCRLKLEAGREREREEERPWNTDRLSVNQPDQIEDQDASSLRTAAAAGGQQS